MHAPRVVLDTNVALSALLFASGRLVWLCHAWQQAQIVPLISAATATELMRVLGYPKFKLSSEEQQELLADYLPYCVTVRNVSRRLNLPVSISRSCSWLPWVRRHFL